MPVPVTTYATSTNLRLRRLALLVLFTLACTAAQAIPPTLRIPLDSLGFQPQSTQFLLAGSSMLTVNYVDNQHLLFTFGVHKLMPRIAGDPPGDEDRTVQAVLVELPSGRVLARTDWRLHDSGQYLWELGHGRFLLRVHDTLTTFAPMVNLAAGRPFVQRGFLTTDRRIGAVLLSPEEDLMIVETAERTPPVPAPRPPLFGPAPKPAPEQIGRPGDPNPVTLSFYRMSLDDSGDEVSATLAGVARASQFGEVAATGAGHIAIVDEGRQQWAFDFHPYNGKPKELAPFASTCDPTLRFVSVSEFVAFGCHSGNAPMILGGFNMRGEEMWEQNLSGEYVGTAMTFAPQSGRFALGRVLGNLSTVDLVSVSAEAYTAQNIVVYQTETGKQLLRVDCSPIARAGQNFALSPDGMSLAVIRSGAIAVYGLPPLSKKDEADVKEARALAPEVDTLPIHFGGSSPAADAPGTAANKPVDPKTAQAPLPGSPTTANVSSPAASPTPVAPPSTVRSAAVDNEATPEQPRKPPTLYTLPGDKAAGPADDGADEKTK